MPSKRVSKHAGGTDPGKQPDPMQVAGDAGRAAMAAEQGTGAAGTGDSGGGGSLFSAYGISGLTRWGGQSRVYEEFLRELQGPQGMKSLREMMDNCPITGAILFAIQHLSRGVTFTWEAANGSNEAHRVAKLCESAIVDDMATTWPDTLSEIMTMLPFGWSLMEMTCKKRLGMSTPVPADADKLNAASSTAEGAKVSAFVPSRFQDGLIGFKSWGLRSQETLYQWDFDTESHAVAMQQMAPPDYRIRTIPLSKGLLFRTQTAKDNPEGRSILRNAWTSYLFKKNIQVIEGIGIERDLAGYPVMQIMKPDPANNIFPPDLWNTKLTDSVAQLATLQKIVRSVRRDEQEGMVLPWWVEFKLLSTGSRRNFDTTGIVERYDSRIAMSVIADFITIGHDSTGSKALVATKSALFTTAMTSFLDIVCSIINRQAIPFLLSINGIPQELAPTLKHGDVENVDIADLGDYIQKLSGAGMPLFPDTDLEDVLRQAAKLPKTRPIDATTGAPSTATVRSDDAPTPIALSKIEKARLAKAKTVAVAHGVGRAAEGKTRAAVSDALKGLSDYVDMKAVARAFDRHDVNAVLAAVDWNAFADHLKPAVGNLVGAYRTAATLANKAVRGVRKDASSVIEPSMVVTNDLAIEFARIASARLVQGITETTRATLQDVVRRALAGEMTKDEAARLIRNIVGLTDQQAMAVENYRAVLLADHDLDADQVESRTGKYADKLLADRGQIIARQEIMTAAREGQEAAWDQAANDGLIVRGQTRKVWIVTDDDRLCPLCEAMDGQTVDLDEDFHSEEGAVGAEGAHIACRCDIGLVFDTD